MSDTKSLITCQCGTFSIPAPQPKPLASFVCHCTECQKQSSSAFGSTAVYPAAGFFPFPDAVMSQLGLWTRPTDSGNTQECYFCKKCGARVMHRSIMPGGKPKDTVRIKGGCLPGFDFRKATHIHTRRARVDIPEGATSFEAEPNGTTDPTSYLPTAETAKVSNK